MKNQKMLFVDLLFLFIGVFFLQVNPLFSQDIIDNKGKGLFYTIDLSLDYLDALQRPALGMFSYLPQDPSEEKAPSASQPRTLGLKKLRISFDWNALRSTEFKMIIRPDALTPRNSGDEPPANAREFDSRAVGKNTVYRQQSAIYFLDSYQLYLKSNRYLSFGLGVFETLAPTRLSYPEVLQFGLQVKLPEKFSGLNLNWKKYNDFTQTSGQQDQPKQTLLDFFFYQGRNDRAETLGKNKKSYDLAPVSADPYYGGAIYFGYWPLNTLELGVLAGYGDSLTEEAKTSEIFVQAIMTTAFMVKSLPTKINLDSRYSTETWQLKDKTITPLKQQSVELTTSTKIIRDLSWLFGLHMGRAEIHRDFDRSKSFTEQNLDKRQPIIGYQVETGILSTIEPGFDLSLLLNEEFRETTNQNNRKCGGFSPETSDTKMIYRIGLEINYKISENG